MRSLVQTLFVYLVFFFSIGCQSKASNRDVGINPIFCFGLGEGKIKCSHNLLHPDAGHRKTAEVEVGKEGDLIAYEGAWLLNAKIAWPKPKSCEITVDFDSGEAKRGLVLCEDGLDGLRDVRVTRDGKAVTDSFPANLPVGKYRVVIKAACP